MIPNLESVYQVDENEVYLVRKLPWEEEDRTAIFVLG